MPTPGSVPAHCFIGGVGMYLYLRRLETGAWGALLGALTFALTGFLVVSLQWPQVVSAAVWLPWLLLCLEWLFIHAEAQAGQRANERAAPWLGMPFWTLLGALAGPWLTLLAGHIEIAFYVLFTGRCIRISAAGAAAPPLRPRRPRRQGAVGGHAAGRDRYANGRGAACALLRGAAAEFSSRRGVL